MTVDLDKMKALALAAPKDWYGIYQIADGVTDNDAAALMKACSPAAVLELIAEVERLRAEVERLEEGMKIAINGLQNIAAIEARAAPAAGTEKDAEDWQLPRTPTDEMRNAVYMALHYHMSVIEPNEWQAADDAIAAMYKVAGAHSKAGKEPA
jgi:hypothetical protein